MIGLDTNVLARYLIESGQEVFMPKTVALELEWVLRGVLPTQPGSGWACL